MKTITLSKILDCLEKETNEILIPEIISRRARRAVERMIAIGRSH
jgi:quinolinate synthase